MKLVFFLLVSFLLLTVTSCKSFPHDKKAHSLTEVIGAAQKQGINAVVHGADHDRKMYVISWSNPQSFFNRYNLVMAPNSQEIAQQFKALNRGDRIFVQGDVSVNYGQAHLLVNKMQIGRQYVPKVSYSLTAGRTSQLPDYLLKKSRAVFYIHATNEANTLLVLEYGDSIIPMVVKKKELVRDLYRGDYVELAFKVDASSDNPYRPAHLLLDHRATNPVEVLDSVLDLHDRELSLEGRLVMFPQSPTINRNIFAIEVPYGNKPARFFTILPQSFENDNFTKLLAKLQQAWDQNPQMIAKGRNKYTHLELTVRAKGRGNVVSPNQANPQIFTTIDDLHIMSEPKKK